MGVKGSVGVKLGTAGAAVSFGGKRKIEVDLKLGTSAKGNVKFEITKKPRPS